MHDQNMLRQSTCSFDVTNTERKVFYLVLLFFLSVAVLWLKDYFITDDICFMISEIVKVIQKVILVAMVFTLLTLKFVFAWSRYTIELRTRDERDWKEDWQREFYLTQYIQPGKIYLLTLARMPSICALRYYHPQSNQNAY